MKKNIKKNVIIISSIIIVIILLIGGNFILNHQKEEKFYSSFNTMNEDYKKVLYSTGQEKEESFEEMTNFETTFNSFKTEYINEPISDIKYIDDWKISLNKIEENIKKARINLDINELKKAHLNLEEVRKEWQIVFVKNDITMLGVYMTDFHDKMEIAIEIEENNFSADSLKVQCNILDESLKVIENTKTENSEDYNNKLTTLRTDLNNFCISNNYENYIDNGAKVKKSFISIYLKYG